jgi:hypothetical protein
MVISEYPTATVSQGVTVLSMLGLFATVDHRPSRNHGCLPFGASPVATLDIMNPALCSNFEDPNRGTASANIREGSTARGH